MKKILIRSGMLPNDDIPYMTMIEKNILGSNVGNLVYAYSIYKNLRKDDDTEFVTTNYKYNYTDDEIADINQNYAYFLLPLADAIRPDFLNELKGLTRLIKKLTIPCHVIGMGIRAPYDADDSFHYDFDDDVKKFIDAVLEKSNIIGVRGNLTANYLSRLGYVEEKDFTIIGCPSMYTFGDNIKIRDENITSSSQICINLNPVSEDNICEFICKCANKFSNYCYIPQDVFDLKIMYAGDTRFTTKEHSFYPNKITNEIFLNGNARFFGNVPSWITFLKDYQLSLGCRLHGNIVATLAGTPSLLIIDDARKSELAQYHQLPCIYSEEINDNTDIFEIINRTDFHSVEKVHHKNFLHYVDFLNQNHIVHMYNTPSKNILFENATYQASLKKPLKPITLVDKNEMAIRLSYYSSYMHNREEKKNDNIKLLKEQKKELQKDYKSLKQTNTKLKQSNTNLEKENKKLMKLNQRQEKTLNYRSVRYALKLRNVVLKIKKLYVRSSN